jgi:hypothetical protein
MVIVSSSVEGMLDMTCCCLLAAVAQVLSVLSDGVSENRCRDSRALSGRDSNLNCARIVSGDG